MFLGSSLVRVGYITEDLNQIIGNPALTAIPSKFQPSGPVGHPMSPETDFWLPLTPFSTATRVGIVVNGKGLVAKELNFVGATSGVFIKTVAYERVRLTALVDAAKTDRLRSRLASRKASFEASVIGAPDWSPIDVICFDSTGDLLVRGPNALAEDSIPSVPLPETAVNALVAHFAANSNLTAEEIVASGVKGKIIAQFPSMYATRDLAPAEPLSSAQKIAIQKNAPAILSCPLIVLSAVGSLSIELPAAEMVARMNTVVGRVLDAFPDVAVTGADMAISVDDLAHRWLNVPNGVTIERYADWLRGVWTPEIIEVGANSDGLVSDVFRCFIGRLKNVTVSVELDSSVLVSRGSERVRMTVPSWRGQAFDFDELSSLSAHAGYRNFDLILASVLAVATRRNLDLNSLVRPDQVIEALGFSGLRSRMVFG